MEKVICIILIFTNLCLFAAEPVAEPVAEPYQPNEFHPILQDIRRASIIFCGAFPLGYMYSSILGDPILVEMNQFPDLDETDKNNKEIEIKLISSLIFSGVVMLIDIIIEKIFKR